MVSPVRASVNRGSQPTSGRADTRNESEPGKHSLNRVPAGLDCRREALCKSIAGVLRNCWPVASAPP